MANPSNWPEMMKYLVMAKCAATAWIKRTQGERGTAVFGKSRPWKSPRTVLA